MRLLSILALIASGCGPAYPTCAPGVPFPCATACGDGVQNGDETDVDCGGHCSGCQTGKACLSAIDCASRVCVNKACAEATCADHVENGRETDVDCGRHASLDAGVSTTGVGACPRCAAGSSCVVGDDCQSGLCAMNVCTPSLCADGRRDGAETGIDCGGPYCPTCEAGKHCADGTDCRSGICSNNVCQ